MMVTESLDPKRTCLLFFDCSNIFVNGPTLDAKNRSAQAAAAVGNWQRQIALARELGVMVVYANAVNREDRADTFERTADIDFRGNPIPRGERLRGGTLDFGSRHVQVVDDIAPQRNDYMIWKRRWSPFYQTRLELSLRSRGVDTIILNGGSVEIGITATVYAVQALDFNIVVVSDGCTSERPEARDALMKTPFRIIGRVRTTDQVLSMLREGAAISS